MDDQQLLRDSRHILLNEVGVEGQERLLDAHVLVVGAGGLGCAAALYLGSAGIGRLTLVDHDVVDFTNLQRQVAHTVARVGLPKVDSLRAAITAINPEVRVTALPIRADAALLDQQLPGVNLVLDCCDNFATRHLINAACVRHRVPLVSGAAIRFDAQVAVYDSQHPLSPCYACLFPPDSGIEETHCATMGVFAPLVGMVGAMQAAEALKWLSHAGQTLTGQLLMLDARDMSIQTMRVARNAQCPVCGTSSSTI